LNDRGDVIRGLVDRGADLNTQDSNGASVLHFGACRGHMNIVELLHNHGADVNSQDGKGNSALRYATLDNNVDVVRTYEFSFNTMHMSI
jgi:ankyrin repeat protein